MTTTRILGAAGLALALLAGGTALATGNQAQTGDMDNAQLRDWLGKLHAGNQHEIQGARLASQKSTDPQVKQLAQHMLSEHTQMDQQVLALAKQRGIDLSSKPAASWADAKQQAAMEKLKAESGADFDRGYAEMMVSDHQDDVKDVTRMRDQAPDRDPTVKKLLADTKDRMQHHLDMAFSTRSALNEQQSPTRQGRRP
ncbi:DUF4142 domain-containing protein [Anaeromyxobacter paludicola]|uniref:DUF4142 domain-containing protein n=1 Tax=Anaeromyxobacter paludicola TaxID=2918171 RepID=A0ABN6N6D5_9BACT|nr:DUF4142 domain-containing protein [Anaeromyxobacter paludicola]BDG08749.1 hypothetical protein AMPC_18620 [Anaeromyxobacter paludicola]